MLYSLFSDLFQNIHTFVDSQLYTLLRVKWYVKMYSRILLDHSHTHTHQVLTEDGGGGGG